MVLIIAGAFFSIVSSLIVVSACAMSSRVSREEVWDN
jgi:hypothetical protein